MDSPPTPNKSEQGKRKTRDTIKQTLLLLIIQREGPIGRYRLKTLLEMADREGVVRAMLEEYQAANIIMSCATIWLSDCCWQQPSLYSVFAKG